MGDDWGVASHTPAKTQTPPPVAQGGDDWGVASHIAATASMPEKLTMDNIPSGHLAMTDPSGNLQAVPHTEATGKMKAGWKIGPPAQQDPSAIRQAWNLSVIDPLKMAGGFASETGNAIAGVGHTLFDPATQEEKASPLGISGTPIARIGKGYVAAVQDNLEKAKKAGDEGKSVEALGRSISAGLPLLGPLVGRGMDIGKEVEQGKMSGPDSAGRALSLVGQVASGAPEKSVIPNPLSGAGAVAGDAARVAKIKAGIALTPAEQLAKTAPTGKIMAVHNAAKVALPEIQRAASGMGQPIQTVEHAIDATKAAKQNLAVETQAKLGEGKTLDDMSASQKAEYQKRLKPLETMQDHLEGLQKQKAEALEKSAKAKGPFADSPVLRAGAKIISPRAVAAGDLLAASRNAAAANGVAASGQIDASVAGAFKPQAPIGMPVPQTPIGQDPFAAPVGPADARVQPQPPAFTRPEPASVGKVTRPAPAIPEPSEPYVSPRMARIKAGEPSIGSLVDDLKDSLSKNKPASTEAPAAKASEPGPPLSKKNQASANLAQRQRMGWRLGNDPPLPESAVQGTKQVSVSGAGPHINDFTGKPVEGSTLNQHTISVNGKPWGKVRVDPSTGEATINPDIPAGTENSAEYARSKQGDIGAGGMKKVVDTLGAMYPDVKEFLGKRANIRSRPGEIQRIKNPHYRAKE